MPVRVQVEGLPSMSEEAKLARHFVGTDISVQEEENVQIRAVS